MKIKITLDDPKTQAIWAAIQRARAEVAAWPAWKRCEDGPARGGFRAEYMCTPVEPAPTPAELERERQKRSFAKWREERKS